MGTPRNSFRLNRSHSHVVIRNRSFLWPAGRRAMRGTGMPLRETVRVRLLGPVDVVTGETARPLSGLRRKAVLATLALHAGEVVSTDRLTDIVWGENAPSTAVNTLQSHVSHLRAVLGSKTAIRGASRGYLLAADETDTDVAV